MDFPRKTDDVFLAGGDLDPDALTRVTADALHGTDDGEMFLEYTQSEAISLDDGQIKTANYDISQGFGLRAVSGEMTAYAQSTSWDADALRRAADMVRAATAGRSGTLDVSPPRTNRAYYGDFNPVQETDFAAKVELIRAMDAYARGRDERVRQVSASLSGQWRAIQIVRANGERLEDVRPLVRLNVSVVVERNGRMESGGHGLGGRISYDGLLEEATWKAAVDEALRQALVNLESVPAPAGEMTVVLGPGWPGILLHEAIGHGLEGDFNRKKTSAFAGLVGQRVAAPGVTVVDDGTLDDRRGSLTIDDEGTPAQRTVLIEDGILKGFMQDRLNARLMGERSTGNGRRQSYAHQPMPRMTNTYMLSGDKDPGEVLASVDKGIYAVSFGGGQVDITSGKFVFSCTEAYKVEGGKIGAPIKGATLIGNGPDALTRVSMIGNDMKLDPGIGTCGKDGQGVPVGVGQPTLRIENLTVGGTAAA